MSVFWQGFAAGVASILAVVLLALAWLFVEGAAELKAAEDEEVEGGQ